MFYYFLQNVTVPGLPRLTCLVVRRNGIILTSQEPMIKYIYAKSCGGHGRYTKILCILFYFHIPSALLQLIDSLANCSSCMNPGLGIRKPQLYSGLVVVFELKPRRFYTRVRGHLFHFPTHLFTELQSGSNQLCSTPECNLWEHWQLEALQPLGRDVAFPSLKGKCAWDSFRGHSSNTEVRNNLISSGFLWWVSTHTVSTMLSQ